MRSPLPQPGNYLGDDPDLAADLGQRLAATAQTGQGLITNYLFYGQRRVAEQQQADRQDRDAGRGRESGDESARSNGHRSVAQAARAARDALERAPRTARPATATVTDQQAETARMTFRLVDPLAGDALADDPSQRDPLTDPHAAAEPERVTLNAEGPIQGR